MTTDTKNKTMSSEEAFLLWKGEAKAVGKARYTASERIEQLDVLCEIFYKYGIDFEEAKSYKKKIVEFMVTREGLKGNGRYKGWKQNTEEDYISLLTRWYNNEFQVVNDITHVNKATKVNEYYGGRDYLERTPLIVAWSKHKFKEKWSESICLETHKVGSSLWNMFKKEVILSNWAKNGNKPDWANFIY